MTTSRKLGLCPLDRKAGFLTVLYGIGVRAAAPGFRAGVQFDPCEPLSCDSAVEGVLNRLQRLPGLDHSPLYQRTSLFAVVGDEPVDDRVKAIERWGKRHDEHRRRNQ